MIIAPDNAAPAASSSTVIVWQEQPPAKGTLREETLASLPRGGTLAEVPRDVSLAEPEEQKQKGRVALRVRRDPIVESPETALDKRSRSHASSGDWRQRRWDRQVAVRMENELLEQNVQMMRMKGEMWQQVAMQKHETLENKKWISISCNMR